jgi:hypothetical protein
MPKDEAGELTYIAGDGAYLCIASKKKLWIFYRNESGAWGPAPIQDADSNYFHVSVSFSRGILDLSCSDGKLAVVENQGEKEHTCGEFHPFRLDKPLVGLVARCTSHKLDLWGRSEHKYLGFQRVSVNKSRYVLSFANGDNQYGFGSTLLSYGEQYLQKETKAATLAAAGPAVICNSGSSSSGYCILAFDVNAKRNSFKSRIVNEFSGDEKTIDSDIPPHHALLEINEPSDEAKYSFASPGVELGIFGGLDTSRGWVVIGNCVVDFACLFGGCSIDYLESQTYDDDQLYCLFTMALQDECSMRAIETFVDESNKKHSYGYFPSIFVAKDFGPDEGISSSEDGRGGWKLCDKEDVTKELTTKIERIDKAANNLTIIWSKFQTLEIDRAEKLSDAIADALAKRVAKLAENLLDMREDGIACVWSRASDEDKDKLKKFVCQPIMVLLLEHIWKDRSTGKLFFLEAVAHIAVIIFFSLAVTHQAINENIPVFYWMIILPLLGYTILRKGFTMVELLKRESKLRADPIPFYYFFLGGDDEKITCAEYVKNLILTFSLPAMAALAVAFSIIMPILAFLYLGFAFCILHLLSYCRESETSYTFNDLIDDVHEARDDIGPDFIHRSMYLWERWRSLIGHVRYSWPSTLAIFVIFISSVDEDMVSMRKSFIGVFVAWTVIAVYYSQARSWRNEAFNAIDIVAALLPIITFAVLQRDDVDHTSRDALVGATIVALWFKLLGIVRGFGRKFATFVIMLKFVVHDVKEFLIVMMIILLAFGEAFYILFLYRGLDNDESGHDNDDAFGSLSLSIYSIFNMMLGQYDDDTFLRNPEAVVLFFAFMILVVIVMLNVLIAIVSDSYDVAMVKGNELYHFAQFEIIMELQPVVRTFKALFLPAKSSARQSHESTYHSVIKQKIKESLEIDSSGDSGRIFDTVNRINRKTERLTKPISDKMIVLDTKIRNIEQVLQMIQESVGQVKDWTTQSQSQATEKSPAMLVPAVESDELDGK